MSTTATVAEATKHLEPLNKRLRIDPDDRRNVPCLKKIKTTISFRRI
jgi:hypothetical protein